MASAWARRKASEAWLTHPTKDRPFDARLCEAFADILDRVLIQPPSVEEVQDAELERG